MFLDINMPEATGLQLAEALQHLKFPPAVVFVTAYSEFALDAFKVNAVDYLVEPVETERLAHALARVREHVVLHARAQKAERIPVEKGGKIQGAAVEEEEEEERGGEEEEEEEEEEKKKKKRKKKKF